MSGALSSDNIFSSDKFNQTLNDFFKQKFGTPIPSYNDDTNPIFDLGFDSLNLVDFGLKLGSVFNIHLELDITSKMSIGQIKELVKHAPHKKSILMPLPIPHFNPLIGDTLEIIECLVEYCNRKGISVPVAYNASMTLRDGFKLTTKRIKGFLWYLKAKYRIFIPLKKLASKHPHLSLAALGSYISQKLSSKLRNDTDSDAIMWPVVS